MKYTTRKIASWLFKYSRICRKQATINAVAGLLLVGLGLTAVEVQRRVLDIATGSAEGSIALFVCLFIAIHVLELLIHVGVTWIRAVLTAKTQNHAQQTFFDHILRSKWSGIGKMHSGDILNRLFGDVNDIVILLTEVVPALFTSLVLFICSFIYLLEMNATMAYIIIIVSPAFALLSKLYFRKMRSIVRKIKDSNSSLQAIIQETIQHKMVVKVLEQGTAMVNNLEGRQSLLRTQIKARARFSIFSKVLITIGFTGAFITGFSWGLFQLSEGLITVGMLMAFTQLFNRIRNSILDLIRLLPSLVNSFTSAERLIELEELPLEEQLPPARIEGKAGIRFTDINYKYTDGGRKVLNHFSHDFAPGSFTAILGETGAGKTTLIRMMLSLIEKNSGEVCLYNESGDTIPISTATRCNFSYVPQGNTLFSGTIRDNLLLGNPSATTAQMREALRIAMADFVFELPEGIYTKCGELGGGLSEGQAQRIAIARSILRPCSILLLDEATSALDIDTERRLLQHIKEHFADTTIIFVTHRLAVADFTSEQFTMVRQTKKD